MQVETIAENPMGIKKYVKLFAHLNILYSLKIYILNLKYKT